MRAKPLLLLLCVLSLRDLRALNNPPKDAPPPPLNERQGNSPHPGFVWKAGYYRWTGNQYRWSLGHWVNPPRPGGVWMPGTWVKHEDHWEFKEGHWKY